MILIGVKNIKAAAGAVISGGQVMRLQGLLLRSSLSKGQQAELSDRLCSMHPYEVSNLVEFLEMNQLDLTQLSNYTKTDINLRLDYIDKKENM